MYEYIKDWQSYIIPFLDKGGASSIKYNIVPNYIGSGVWRSNEDIETENSLSCLNHMYHTIKWVLILLLLTQL